MNLKDFICSSLDVKDCLHFDIQKAIEKAQEEVEKNYSLQQKAREMDLIPCYSSN